MEHMLLTLLPDAAQQDALNQLLDAQHNPESPYYHQWLTPEQYGERFGISDADTAQIVGWLQDHGMEVEEVTAGRRSIVFSGTAAQVAVGIPYCRSIPTRLATNSIMPTATILKFPPLWCKSLEAWFHCTTFTANPCMAWCRKPSPEFTSGGSHYLAPADFATIYDLVPLYQQSINGSGQSIAIVARSNINIADVRQFRTFFGLPANDPQIIVNGTDPGIFSSGEETEADLDVEWSGAVARMQRSSLWFRSRRIRATVWTFRRNTLSTTTSPQ